MASSSRLQPGEKGKITVTVDIRGRAGRVLKTVRVYANDPNKPVTTLSIRVHITDPMQMNQ
jgi:hypothetical protein